jgi:hypothetical protein
MPDLLESYEKYKSQVTGQKPSPKVEPRMGVLKAAAVGAARGLTTELPAMIGAALEFTSNKLGVEPAEEVGRSINEWAEKAGDEWFGKEPESGVERIVYQGASMLAPSIIPGGLLTGGARLLLGVGKLVKGAKVAYEAGEAAKKIGNIGEAVKLISQGDIALARATKLAKTANTIGSSMAAGLFGLQQAQNTKDSALKQAEVLEAQGDYEGAEQMRKEAEGMAPLYTGAIEATGEYFGTKYLSRMFGLSEAEVFKRGGRSLVKDFLKTLGVEVGTEIGQAAGEAGVEKMTGIRPDAEIMAEALDVIGPTAFMTILTGGFGVAMTRKERAITKKQSDEMGDRETEVKKIVTEAREPVTPPVDEGLIERVPVTQEPTQEPPTAGAGAVPIQPTPAPAPTIPGEPVAPAAPAVEIPTLPSLDEYWGLTPKAMDGKLDALDKFHKDIMASAKTEAERIRNEIKGLKGKEDEASLAKKAELQGLLGTVEKQAINIQTAIKTGEKGLFDQVKEQVMAQIEGTPEQKQKAWDDFRTEWKNQPEKPLGEILKGVIPVKEVKPSEERKAETETVLSPAKTSFKQVENLQDRAIKALGLTSWARWSNYKNEDNENIKAKMIELAKAEPNFNDLYYEKDGELYTKSGRERLAGPKEQGEVGHPLLDMTDRQALLDIGYSEGQIDSWIASEARTFQEKLKAGAKALTGAKKKGKAKAEPATREKPIENAPLNLQKFALSKALKHAKARGIDFATLGPGSVVQIRPGDLAKYKEGTFVRISEEGFKAYNERRAKRAKQAAGAASAPAKTLRQFIKQIGGLATDDPDYGGEIRRLQSKKGWPVGSFGKLANGAKRLSEAWQAVVGQDFDFVTPDMEEADLLELLRTNPPINKGVKEKAETQVKEEGKKEDEEKTLEAGALLFGSTTVEEARKALEGKYGKDWYFSEEFDRDLRAASTDQDDEESRLRAEIRPKLEAYLRREDYKEGVIPGLIDQIFADEAKLNEILADIEAYEKQAKGGEEGEVPFEEALAEEKKPVKALTGAKGKKAYPDGYSADGKILRVWKAPFEGWTWYKTDNLKKTGTRVKLRKEEGTEGFFDTKEAAQAALAEYAEKNGHAPISNVEFVKQKAKSEKVRPATELPIFRKPAEEPKLPEGLEGVAGEKGLKQVTPNVGDTVWTTSSETGKLEAIRYGGKTGKKYDQYEYEKWTWLTGPEKGKDDTAYGRTFWIPEEPKPEAKEEKPEEKPPEKPSEPEPSELQELRKQVLVLQNEPMRIVSKRFKTPITELSVEDKKKFDRMIAVETKMLQPKIDALQAKIDEILAKPEPETQRLFGEEVTGKPIWQMTKAENWNAFLESRPKQPWNGEPSLPSIESNLKALIKKVDETHKAAVKQALEEGKPVPEKVLDDYPDLKPPEPPQKSLLIPKKEKTLFEQADELDALIEEEEPGRREMLELPAPETAKEHFARLMRESEGEENKAKAIAEAAGGKPIVLRNTDGTRGVVIHKSVKEPGAFQVTYWDEKGFSGDFAESTLVKAIREALRSGYTIPGGVDLDKIARSRKFRKWSEFTEAYRKYWEGERAEGVIEIAETGRREMAELPAEERNFQAVSKALEQQLQDAQAEGKTVEQFIKERADKISPRVAPYFERWANEKTGQNAGNIQPAGGRVEAPAGGAGEATLGGARRADLSGRLRVPEPSLLPRPGRYVDDGRFSILRGDQRFAANLAVQGWKDGKQANLNASGVGSGKTLTGIAVADTISRLANEDAKLKAEGRTKVLIVVPSKAVLETRWIPDASEKAGVDLTDTTKFELGTVHDMRAGKIGKGKYAAIVLDESQMYGDPESQRTIAQEKIDSSFRYYMSATPGDQPFKFSLFMSKITGQSPEAIQKALGVNIEWYEDPKDNELKMRCTLMEGSTWHEVKANVIKYRNEAMRQGNLFRSWYVPDVELREDALDWNTAQEEEQHSIAGYWDDAIRRAGSPMKKMNLGRLRIGELRRSIETYKVDAIYRAAMKSLAEGKHVVVVFKGYNKTLIRAIGLEKGQYGGFGEMFEAKLKREGTVKEWAKIYGQRDKSEEIRKFQSGQVKLALMTPESGGMGIDLDDKFGNSPREVLIANVDFSGEVFEQVLGRIYRGPTTKSRSVIRFFNYRDSIADKRAWNIVGQKVGAVKALQHGYDMDAMRLDVTDERGENKTLFFYNNQDSLLAGHETENFGSKIERIKAEIETDKIPAINEIEHRLVSLMEGNKMPMFTLDKTKAESLSNLLKLSLVTQQMKAGQKPISAYIETPAKGVYEFRRPYGWFVYREGGIVEVKERREMAEGGKEQRTPEAMLQLIRSLQPAGQGRALVSISELRDKAVGVGKDLTPKLKIKEWEGRVGDRSHTTRLEEGFVPTESISHLMGEVGEVRGAHRNRTGKDWEAFKEDIRQNGIKEPIFILKDPGKPAVISEGNHRLDAAIELGMKEVPVEIKYFGHSEKEGLAYNQSSQGKMTNAEFDAQLLQLAQEGKVALHQHDFAMSLKPEERAKLLAVKNKYAKYGDTDYYVGVVPKAEVKQEVNPPITKDHPELKKAIDVGNGVMVTTAFKDPVADAKAKEIVNANKDLLAMFGRIPKLMKQLFERSGFKDIPDFYLTVDPTVRGYVPNARDMKDKPPAFVNPFGLTTSIDEMPFYTNNAERMGNHRLRAHGFMQAHIHEYAEYLTRNSPTVHGSELVRVAQIIDDSIDPKEYAKLHDYIAEEIYGKHIGRIQSVGKDLSELATKGSKIFRSGSGDASWRRDLAEAATANRGDREQALARGGFTESAVAGALSHTIFLKANADHIVAQQAGQQVTQDIQDNRLFAMKIFEMTDPALAAVNNTVQKLQTEIQSLAGPRSKRKFYAGIGYQPKFKRSEQSDILDEAIRVYVDSGGEQAGPILEKFKDEATRALNDVDQYLKDRGITEKDKLGRYQAIRSPEHRQELRKWLRAIEQAEKLTADQKEFAEKMKDLFEEGGLIAKEHGYLKSFVDNYVRRIYKFKPWQEENVDGTGGHGFRLRFGPNQQRSYKFLLDAVLDGYQVGVRGITNSYGSYMRELAQVIANNTFKKAGMKTLDANGNKLFTTKERPGFAKLNGMYVWEWAGDVQAEKEVEGDEVLTVDDYGKKFFVTTPVEIPEYWAVYKSEDAGRASRKFLDKEEALAWAKEKGYTRIERRRPMDRSEIYEKRQVNAPAPLAEIFNKVTATDQFFFKAPALNALLRWNTGTKAWVLMTSFFHHMAGTREWAFSINHGFKWYKPWEIGKVIPVGAYKQGLDKVMNNHPLVTLGIKNGLTLGEVQDYSEIVLAQNKGIAEKLATKFGLDKAVDAIEKVKRFRENQTNALFKKFFAGLKAEGFVIEYTHELQRLTDLYSQGKLKNAPDVDRVAEAIANRINLSFGGLHLRRMGRNPTIQKMVRLLLLAPDWTESNFRYITGLIPGVNDTINKMVGDLPEIPGTRPIYQRMVARIMLRIIITTVLANLLLNGKDDTEEMIEEQMFSNRFNRFRWTELEITKLYQMLGIDTQNERKTFSIGGHFFDPLKLIDPFNLFKAKAAPAFRVAEATLSGTDWAERPYTGVKELLTTGKAVKKSYHQPKEESLDRLPSVIVNQIVNLQPIQLGHFIRLFQGEEDALSALLLSAGAAVHTAWAPRAETPIAPVKSGDDTALDTIKDLKSTGSLKAGPPSRYVTINLKSYQMTPQQYKDFFEKSSDMARPKLEKLVESDSFKKLTEEKRAEIIDRIISNARRKARLKVKREMLQQIKEGTLKEAA